MNHTHRAWDGGAILAALDAVIMPGASDLVAPRTTKAKCGARVVFKRIDNERPSCPACIREREDETRALAEWHRLMKGVE